MPAFRSKVRGALATQRGGAPWRGIRGHAPGASRRQPPPRVRVMRPGLEPGGIGVSVFGAMANYDYGEVHFARDAASGLQAIVAIHDTRLGPALGGCRFLAYEQEEDALVDALRLARGMTYKAALADLPHGGGKSVLIRPAAAHFDRAELFMAFGRFVDDLGGHYITAEDSGTGLEDMTIIRSVTPYVTGVDVNLGGSGDPSPFTAYGTLQGLMATLNRKYGNEEVGQYSYAVQGLGHVGMEFVKLLRERGAKVFVTDINKSLVTRAVDELGAEAVGTDEIYDVQADVYSPCALGGTVNENTLPRLKAKVICGAANNQLANNAIGDEVEKRGIVYAPDYAVNAGGVMNVALEITGYNRERAMRMMRTIYHNLARIYEIADRDGIPTYKAADRMAEERIAMLGKLKLPLGRSKPRFEGRIRGGH
jgi:leucine dehydrogenase